MRDAWLLLGLATELQLLFTYGFDFKRPLPALFLLLPVALPFLLKRLPVLRPGWPLKIAGLLSFHAALFFARRQVLLPFDARDLFQTLMLAVTCVGAAWVLRSLPSRQTGGFELAWIGLWLLSGLLDPVLPILGLGLMALLMAFGRWPEAEGPAVQAFFAPWFVLGLVLLKPRWDYGLELAPALAMGTFALGWFLSRRAAFGLKLGRKGTLLALGALGILYAPGVLWAWGLLAGLAWGWRQKFEAVDEAVVPILAAPAGGLLAGVILSFALHANAWLPGLRHVIWLGN